MLRLTPAKKIELNCNGLVQEASLEMGLKFIIITVNYQQQFSHNGIATN